jgi:hypothetical protein
LLAKYYVLFLGVAFLAAGIGGFIPLFTPPALADAPPLAVAANYGYLLGLFPVNVIHTLYHLAVGVWGLLAYRQPAAARTYLRVMAVTLGIFTLMGLLPTLSTAFGLLPLFGHDIWLHGVEAILAAYLGFFTSPEPARALETT